ncbi:MAG: site-specific integrase [Planctomycetes bacterium]|nr:site-specific integrase [Planctomycetota bacterium]
MTKRTKQIPSLRLHPSSGRGFVELNGKRKYLGRYDDPETRLKYDRAVSEWMLNNRRPTVDVNQITVTELIDRFWLHADAYYRKPDRSPTSQISCYKLALKPLKRMYGTVRAVEFGPLALKAIRQAQLEKGVSRGVLNKIVSLIRSVFRWGASEELIPGTVITALGTLAPLRAGRSEARETDPILPVPEAHVDAVKPFVSSQVWSLIQLQLLTGARAGELVKLRLIDLDMSEKVWQAELKDHKTAYRGRKRIIYFGPQAQSIIQKFIPDRAVDTYLFSPREAHAERRSKDAKSHRRPGQAQTPRKTKRVMGDCYTTCTYRQAIRRGCEAASVDIWTPHRLRHSAGTSLRKQFGVEMAQIMLGHSKADVTQLYAERDEAKAVDVAAKIG